MNPKGIMPVLFPFLRIDSARDGSNSRQQKNNHQSPRDEVESGPLSEEEARGIADMLRADSNLAPLRLSIAAECVEGEWQVVILQSKGEKWRILRRGEGRRVLLAHQSDKSGANSGRLLDRRI